jgi:hypothetical protein
VVAGGKAAAEAKEKAEAEAKKDGQINVCASTTMPSLVVCDTHTTQHARTHTHTHTHTTLVFALLILLILRQVLAGS